MRGFTPERRLQGVAFLVATAYWPAIFAAPTMPRWWAIAILVPLLFGLDWRKVDPATGLLWLAGLAWCIVQAMTIPDALRDAVLPWGFLLLIGLAGWAASSVDDLEPALQGFGWGLAVSSLVSVLQFFDLAPLHGQGRPNGLFFNSEVMALAVAPVMAWAFMRQRWVLTAALGLGLALTASRIGILAVLVALFWAWKIPAAIKVALLMVVGSIIFILVTSLDDQPLARVHSAAHRVVLWGAAVHSLTLEGTGLGWWASAHPYGMEEFVHSDALQFVVEAGLGGLFFLAVPLLILWRGIPNPAEGALFVALCFEGLVSFPLHVPASAFLFGIAAGHISGAWYRLRVAERQGGTDRGAALRWAIPNGHGMAGGGAGDGRRLRDRPTHTDDPGRYPAPYSAGARTQQGMT